LRTEARSPRLTAAASAAADATALIAAWLIGIAGVIGSIRGRGPIVVFGPVATDGIRIIAPMLFGWTVIARVASTKTSFGPLGAAFAAATTVSIATASNVGRVQGLVAVVNTFVAYAALADRRPLPRLGRRRNLVVPAALPGLLVAYVAWSRWASLAWTGAALATSLLAVLWAQLPAEVTHRVWQRGRTGAARFAGPRVAGAAGALAERLATARRTVPAATMAKARAGATAARGGLAPSALRARVAGASEVAVVGAAAAVATAIVAPVFARLSALDGPAGTIVGINDHGDHLRAAADTTLLPLEVETPHFAYHVLTAAGSALVSLSTSATVVLSLATGATFIAAYLLLRPLGWSERTPSRPALAGAAAFLAIETPTLILLHLGLVAPSTRFQTVHALYSPTWVVALPLAILLVVAIRPVLEDVRAMDRRRAATTAGLTVALLLAKPSFVLCLVPALATVVAVRRVPWRTAARVIGPLAAPAGVVLAWQARFLAGSDTAIGGGGVTFDPIGGPPYGWSQARWAFWFPLLLVVLAVVLRGREAAADRTLHLLVWCLAYGATIFLLFQETGVRAGHGNLGVSAQVASTVLVLWAVGALVRELMDVTPGSSRGPRLRWLVAAGAMLAFCWGGLLSYADAMGWLQIPIRWDEIT
jgi:hypothetical protein